MNMSSNLVQTHNYKKNSNFQRVGLTPNPFCICHCYKLPEPLQAPAHCSSRPSNYFPSQCRPCLFTFKLWHRFCNFLCQFWHDRVSAHKWKHVPIGCVNCPYVWRHNFLLKRGYVSVVSTTNIFQWRPLNSTRPHVFTACYWTSVVPLARTDCITQETLRV